MDKKEHLKILNRELRRLEAEIKRLRPLSPQHTHVVNRINQLKVHIEKLEGEG